MTVGLIANWIVVVLIGLAAIGVTADGLAQRERPARECGPSEVFAGCLSLVVCGFALWHLWSGR